MAKSILAGFVKGFAGRQLDNIDSRRKLEAEEKKARLLQQLQQETSEWEWANSPTVKQGLRESDSRIKENEAQAFRDRERLALDRERMGFDQKLALRNAARLDADSASERSYREKRLALDGTGKSDGSLSGEDSALKVATALQAQHKATIDSLVESGVDPLEIEDYSLQFATNPNIRGNVKGAELSKFYMQGLRKLRADPRASK